MLREQLEILNNFINKLDFIKMKPDNSVIKNKMPENVTARALVQKGIDYAIYINGGDEAELVVELPSGVYTAEWINTKTGKIERKEKFQHGGGERTLHSPNYLEDIALRIQRTLKNS